jgi:ATP phosphoribosyltransferase
VSDLVLALPSKGRLQENAQAFFARAGLDLVQAQGERDYRARIAGLDGVEIAYLSSSEIARELSLGNVHLGVTGEDLIREQIGDVDARIAFVTPLGFGRADVVVAVPKAWIDVATMTDLDDVASTFRGRHGRRFRVATKYINLTRRFFAAKGVVDYRIVESLGATEGSPAAGAAEAIVDITTTGRTLAANGLKVIDDGVILRSEAHLVAARAAAWTREHRDRLRVICDRVAAEARARATREIRFAAAHASTLAAAAADRFAATAPFAPAGDVGTLHVAAGKAFALADWLRASGARMVTIARLDYVYGGDDARSRDLIDSLTRA